MKKDFEIVNHTADVGIIAYGADVKQAFANAATGLFSLITELDDIQETLYRDIEVTATDKESLLVEWLTELIYRFDTENIIFNRFYLPRLLFIIKRKYLKLALILGILFCLASMPTMVQAIYTNLPLALIQAFLLWRELRLNATV